VVLSSKIPRIGILISDIESAYQSFFFDEMHKQAAEAGIKAIFYSGTSIATPIWYERQMNISFHLANSKHLDGLLSATSTFMRAGAETIVQRLLDTFKDIPRVSVTADVLGVPSILIDNVGGFRQMIEHLVHDHAYRDFAFLSGPAGSHDSQQRLKTFRTVMVEAGIYVDPRLIQSGEFHYSGARQACERILDMGLPVRVIVAANDEMALAAIAVAAERGIRVPEELAVVGVDDLHPHVTGIRLTTVNNAIDQQIALSLGALRVQLEGCEAPPVTMVATRLVRRQSCGCSIDSTLQSSKTVSALDLEASLLDSLQLNTEERERFERYLPQCMDSLPSEDPSALERVVWSMASECLEHNGDIAKLQSMLLGIQTLLLDPDALSAREMWRCGRQLNSAQIVLVKAKTMYSIANGDRVGMTLGSINFLKRQLLSFEIHQQMDKLPDVLANFGVKTCIIAFYEEQGYFNTSNDYLIPTKARLVACVIDGKRHNELLWSPFDTDQLLPELVWQMTGDKQLIVMPAFQQVGHYGYIIFGPERPMGMSFEGVREAIASALIGALLVEEIGRVRDYLATQAKRLTRTTDSIKQINDHDPSSGLLNRAGFLEEAAQRVKSLSFGRHLLVHAHAEGIGSATALMGKAERDFATEQAARVFAGALRASDLAARLADDRFVALCSDVDEDFRRDLKIRLEIAFDHFNRNAAKPYKLGCRLIFSPVGKECEVSVLANFLDHPTENNTQT